MLTEVPEMNVEVGAGGARPLPVYLLLDCSTSMGGHPIEAVRHGVETFARETRHNEFANQIVRVGVITFASEAHMVTSGLVPINEFQPPQITASGSTSLGKALRVLQNSLDTDVKPSIKGRTRGDYKPLIFILTDGAPTDDWRTPHAELQKRLKNKVINVITVGCGTSLDEALLREIAIGPTFKMDASDASFEKFFKYVSQTVQSVSASLQAGAGDQPVAAVAPDPNVFQYIP